MRGVLGFARRRMLGGRVDSFITTGQVVSLFLRGLSTGGWVGKGRGACATVAGLHNGRKNSYYLSEPHVYELRPRQGLQREERDLGERPNFQQIRHYRGRYQEDVCASQARAEAVCLRRRSFQL